MHFVEGLYIRRLRENVMIKSFPKIFHLGDRHLQGLFDDVIEVTEKIDGSQFCFMATEDGLYMRSKGAMIYSKDHFTREVKENDLFFPATRYVLGLYENEELPIGWSFFCETLCRPRHSTLAYENIPRNNLVLFGCIMSDGNPIDDHRTLKVLADNLEIDVAPLIFHGEVLGNELSQDVLNTMLNRISYLGGQRIEGIVVKRYAEHFVGGQLLPIMAGKYVSEQFKEVHRKNWTKQNTGAGKWQEFKESYKTEARWEKAVQYLRESGLLTETPRDIGPLIQRVVQDITEEEKENIQRFLWREFGRDLLRQSTHGLPEWWKSKLATGEK